MFHFGRVHLSQEKLEKGHFQSSKTRLLQNKEVKNILKIKFLWIIFSSKKHVADWILIRFFRGFYCSKYLEEECIPFRTGENSIDGFWQANPSLSNQLRIELGCAGCRFEFEKIFALKGVEPFICGDRDAIDDLLTLLNVAGVCTVYGNQFVTTSSSRRIAGWFRAWRCDWSVRWTCKKIQK